MREARFEVINKSDGEVEVNHPRYGKYIINYSIIDEGMKILIVGEKSYAVSAQVIVTSINGAKVYGAPCSEQGFEYVEFIVRRIAYVRLRVNGHILLLEAEPSHLGINVSKSDVLGYPCVRFDYVIGLSYE